MTSRWGVFARDHDGADGYTWLCSGTSDIRYAEAWLAQLGAPLVVGTQEATWSTFKAAYGD